ncbi:hypothetical protein B0T26DRAFT_735444 [Lasiosphaeria miniovina]|uniref:Uncharacterized protein n=1 Tax=Lasiosphaeria miniovina TaxID=1954250 RepID=A0AA40DG99_9PEZI|nr:uncharacterized protein B0T26DRAFT_735444 [Lasiosphaeria miniovina]KAK0701975.1 hypothetical protein B0T26DRAFT_735444 [Lasiosphaeria miniovina]
MVVLETQSEGEPNHWSLFVAREGSGSGGSVYQVTGDATYMTRKFDDGVQHLSSESYLTSYVVAYLDEAQAGVVRQIATQEPPPWAHNRALVTENCQGWTVRVLRRLQSRGIGTLEFVQSMEAMMQPV